MTRSDQSSLSRRQFLGGLSGLLAVSGTLVPRRWAAAREGHVTEEQAKEIYRKGISIDCLASPNTVNILWPPPGPLTQIQLDNVKASGLTAVNLTVGGSKRTFEETVRKVAFWTDQLDEHASHLTLIRHHRDFDRAKREGRLGLIFGFQDTTSLGEDLTKLEVFYQLGVRLVQVTYNGWNLMGNGCLEPADAGLSVLGREAIAMMNEMGIAVDLSHCGTRTTADGIEASSKPPLITHSGCREVTPHPRSKEDRELRAMAEKGGVVGIYMVPFLDAGPGAPSEDIMMQHIEHALNVCGAEHVGIGSDLGITPVEETPEYMKAREVVLARRRGLGISSQGEERPVYIPTLNHPRRLEGIAVTLAKRGHSASTIEGVIGGNFHRVFGEIWRS